MTKEREIENKKIVEKLISEIEDLIRENLEDKTSSKKYPFIEEPKPTVKSKPNYSLPLALKNFGEEEEKNWIFYGPPGTGKTFALNTLNKIKTIEIVINDDITDYKLQRFYAEFQLINWAGNNGVGNINSFIKIIHAFLAFPFLNFGIQIVIKKHSDPDKHKNHPLLFSSSTEKYEFLVGDNYIDNVGYSKFDDNIIPISRPQSKKREIEKKEAESVRINYDFLKERLFIIIKNIFGKNHFQLSDVKKIVFHPSYTYEDFVGGIKPDLEKTGLPNQLSSAPGSDTQGSLPKPNPQTPLTYKYTRGVMLDLIHEAWGKKGIRYYLIIDEFNRGNIAAIFGEFLYLIENDKRSEKEDSGNDYVFLPGGVYPWKDKEKVEPFSEECKIRMPKNIFIVGALNTADRSIATMDFAMRRRFNFVKFEPNEELITGFTWKSEGESEPKDVNTNVKRLFVCLNRSIKYILGDDHEIGHSYFMPTDKENTKVFLKDLFERKIVPLLEAYCDHDEHSVKKILKLTESIINNDEIKTKFDGQINEDEKMKYLKNLSVQIIKPIFRKALEGIEAIITNDLYGELIKQVNPSDIKPL